jgi:serine protease Do
MRIVSMQDHFQIVGQIGAMLLAAVVASPLGLAQPAPPAHPAGIAMQSSPYLGVSVMNVDEARAKALKLKEERGAWITGVDNSGPAAKAGVKVGDVVLEYNGQPVQDSEQLQHLVRETSPGRDVKLSVWRNGAAQTVNATIENRRMAMIEGEPWFAMPMPGPSATPGPAPMASPMPSMPPMPPMPNLDFDIPRIQTILQNTSLGIAGEPLGDEQQFAEFFGVKDGILVKAVDSNSPAEHAGIKAGDVIVKVGEARVGSLRELSAALRTLRMKGTYTVTVVRNKKETSVTVVSAQHGG